MVTLHIKELLLDAQTEHLATDWQVSTTLNFSNVILSSMADYTHLTTIVFNTELDPNVKYYARARALLSTGYTAWGNLDIFTPMAVDDMLLQAALPSRIAVPVLSTDSVQYEHDTTLFTISAVHFAVVGNSEHTYTSYLIEDITGDIVWSSLHDINNLNSILVNNVILSPGIYRVKACFGSNTNDVSQMATYTINVVNDKTVYPLAAMGILDPTIDNPITYINTTGMTITSLTYELYRNVSGILTLVTNGVSTGLTVDIPANILAHSSSYVLRTKVPGNNYWSYYEIVTI